VDPINPITPGALPVSVRLPVQPLERITRERDRPAGEERRRRRPAREQPDEHGHEHDDGREDDGRPHVDVRV